MVCRPVQLKTGVCVSRKGGVLDAQGRPKRNKHSDPCVCVCVCVCVCMREGEGAGASGLASNASTAWSCTHSVWD